MNSITDYKGLILITFIILAILYFSPDLECMLLFSGILVNIITICLNTGALKIATAPKEGLTNRVPENFIYPDDTDAIDKYMGSNRPNFNSLAKADELLQDLPASTEPDEKPQYCGEAECKKEGLTATRMELKPVPPVDKTYKGAIDYEDASEPMQIGADRIPLVSAAHQGINARRQMGGAYNKHRTLYPAVARELEESESKRWWGNYDMVTTNDAKTTPY